MRKTLAILLLIIAMLLVACGGEGEESVSNEVPSVAGDATRGEQLYTQNAIGSAPGCITCHSLESGVTLVGPSHSDIGARAASVVPGQSAEAYLYQSIIEPDAHITEGFTAGLMYQNYQQDLSEQEIADLVAFLTTLG